MKFKICSFNEFVVIFNNLNLYFKGYNKLTPDLVFISINKCEQYPNVIGYIYLLNGNINNNKPNNE